MNNKTQEFSDQPCMGHARLTIHWWLPVSESARKLPKLIFHLIKSVAVTQTRTCRLSWFSGGFVKQPFWIFFSYLHRSTIYLHRYGEYWRPRAQSDCTYFATCVISMNMKPFIAINQLNFNFSTFILLDAFPKKCSCGGCFGGKRWICRGMSVLMCGFSSYEAVVYFRGCFS